MNETECDNQKLNEADITSREETNWQIEWRNAAPLIFMHVVAPYSIYLIFTEAKWQTNLFAFLTYIFSTIGVTAGSHRLWSHKSYKAKLPLQIILLILSTITFQGSALHWARDHRLHHKYADTDADPQNSKRGFFYSHFGWVMLKKSSIVKTQGQIIDISDLQKQPLLQLQHKYFMWLGILLSLVVPSLIPILWGESVWTAFFVAASFRLMISANSIFLINSVAHLWGTKPYEKDICPTENNMVSLFAMGEGFHNYHHTFPQDYRAAELGGYTLNFTRLFIDVMAKIGWAYDLKTISEELIEKRVNRTGDGTHPVWSPKEQIHLGTHLRQKGA